MLYYMISKVSDLRILFVISACLLSFNYSTAQDTEPSPWSRFGMGLTIPTLSSPQLLMGGVSSPMVEGNTINPDQPASAAGCTTTLFQTSMHGSRNAMVEGDSSTTAVSGTIGSISVVVKKTGGKTAMMFGMLPYSAQGYNVQRGYEDPLLGDVIEQYEGTGGTAKSYVGFARSFRGKKWISAGENDSILVNNQSLFLGAQANYLFGEVTQTGRLDILDATYLDNRTRTSMRHRSLGGLFGIQAYKLLWAKYDENKSFKHSSTLYLGGTYGTSSTLYTDYEKIVETVQLLSNVETPIDTAYYVNSLDVEGRTPSRWTAGGALSFDSGNGRRILLAADYMQEDWSSVADELEHILTGNATWAKASRTSFGLTIRPKSKGITSSVLTRSTIRTGFAMDAYPISYDGFQLKGWRASAGISIPLEGSRSNSNIHFGFEVGHRGLDGGDNGTVLANTLQESLFNIQFGVSLAPFFKNLWLTPKLYD
jgi:hypothetical protein